MHFKKYQKGIKTCFFFFSPKKGKPNKKKKKVKQKDWSLQSVWWGPPAFWFTIHSSKQFKLILIIATWFAWVLLLFILNFFFFFLLRPTLHRWLTWHGGGRFGWLVYCGIILHGLPTQQISRQQGVNGGGAPDHAGVFSARRSPQAGVLGHPSPQQVASAGLSSSAAAPLANWVGLRCPAHPVLIGSWVGLPTSGVRP